MAVLQGIPQQNDTANPVRRFVAQALRNLSPTSTSILRAAIAGLRPRGHGFDQPIDEDVLAEIDRTIPCFPPLFRLGFWLGLRVLEWGPLVFTGRPTRLTRMGCDQATRYLDGWLRSRSALRRMLLFGVRTLVYLAFYQHPSVLHAMEVDWDRRMGETIRLRADTLDRETHADPR